MRKIISIILFLSILTVSTIAIADSWTCPTCGNEATLNFCNKCGTANPSPDWICPKCRSEVSGNFCNNCGNKKPMGTSKILFKNIPWGITYKECLEKYNLGYAAIGFQKTEYLMNSFRRYDVAGWPIESSYLHFTVPNIELNDDSYSEDDNFFYRATYRFAYTTKGENAIFDDLEEKLKKLYGEPAASEYHNSKWYSNGVRLELSINGAQAYMEYVWEEGEKINQKVQAALYERKIRETEVDPNNTNGL